MNDKSLLMEEPFDLEPVERHELEPRRRSLDVAVALSKQWHGEPMGFDPDEPRDVG